MSYANRGTGCGTGMVGAGATIGAVISFLVWLIYGAVSTEWRDATRAGAIIAMVGFAIWLIGLLITGVEFAHVLGLGLVIMAFPTAMYHWAVGNAHGYAWLWIFLWMAGLGVAIMFLKWLSTRDV